MFSAGRSSASPPLPLGAAQTPSPNPPVFLYAAVGPELATYGVGASNGTLTKTSSVTLPFAVQYVWPHPSTRFLYVAWSNGMQGDRHGITAYRIDTATGALSPHGQPIEIRHRPVHLTLDADATHVLVAYNNPSSLSVHDLNADGTLGSEVKQPAPIDGGIYAHQIRVHPSNKMVVMVTRGNGPAPNRPEDPGALKIYSYKDGIVANRQSIAPNGGFGYQPRHVDFHPTLPFMYLNLERQNQLQVYRTIDGESVEPKALFTKDTLDNQAASKPAQMTGAIHVHPERPLRLHQQPRERHDDGRRKAGVGRRREHDRRVCDRSEDRRAGADPEHRQRRHARAHVYARPAVSAAGGGQSECGDESRRHARACVACRVSHRRQRQAEFLRKYDVETGQGGSLMWAGFVRLK